MPKSQLITEICMAAAPSSGGCRADPAEAAFFSSWKCYRLGPRRGQRRRRRRSTVSDVGIGAFGGPLDISPGAGDAATFYSEPEPEPVLIFLGSQYLYFLPPKVVGAAYQKRNCEIPILCWSCWGNKCRLNDGNHDGRLRDIKGS